MSDTRMNQRLFPDDTTPRLPDTQPIQPYRRPPRAAWLALMVISAVTLLATLRWAWERQSLSTATAMPSLVVLVEDGKRTDYRTFASTVGDFLTEASIALTPEDRLSEPLEMPIKEAMVITIARARDVSITLDGARQTLRTAYRLPHDILRQANISLSDSDRITLDGVPASPAETILWTIGVDSIDIQRAVDVVIVDNGQETRLISSAATVGEVLLEANVTLYLTDIVSPAVAEPLRGATRITITRAQPIFIQVDNKRLETRVQGGTVAEALSEAGVALLGLDYAYPDEDTPVTSGMTIDVIRVTEDTFSQDSSIPFEVTYQADPNLPLDTRQIVQVGKEGILRQYTRVRYEDGVEVSREGIGQEVILAPTPQVVAYGTNVVLYPLETPEGTLQYWRKLRVYATSYHPAELGGDNITAIGEVVRRGIIGADPKIIPYRTPVYVAGYGTGIIADTGGPRSSPYWIDLGYTDEEYVGWSKYVDIYLLAPIPATINYLLPEWTPLRNTSGW
jgi:uncharacterized protein YabE (DUF348 family)